MYHKQKNNTETQKTKKGKNTLIIEGPHSHSQQRNTLANTCKLKSSIILFLVSQVDDTKNL